MAECANNESARSMVYTYEQIVYQINSNLKFTVYSDLRCYNGTTVLALSNNQLNVLKNFACKCKQNLVPKLNLLTKL